IDTHPHKAFRADLVPDRFVLLLPLPLDRGHHIDLRPLREGENLLDDLIGGLRADWNLAVRAPRLAEPGVEHAQVVIDFRDRTDGRARTLAGGLLLDADRRRKATDVLDLGLLHLPEELSGVAR